jgi:glycosyltransferase involved in cell wall biosynthesis
MGVDLGAIPIFRETDHKMAGKKYMVLYLGTLAKFRRLDLIIRAFAMVLKDLPNSQLVFVGAGEEDGDEEYLVKQAQQLGILDNILLTGFLPQERAWKYVREADVCLSPFYPTFILLSTSPTKLIEYMAMGKPVVANEHPEQSEVLMESGAGILVQWSEKSFADAIIYLLKHPKQAKIMGEHGRAYVENNRSYRKLAATFENALEMAMSS